MSDEAQKVFAYPEYEQLLTTTNGQIKIVTVIVFWLPSMAGLRQLGSQSPTCSTSARAQGSLHTGTATRSPGIGARFSTVMLSSFP